MKAYFENKDVMRMVFIGVASVRNSMDLIITYIAEWVSRTFSFASALGEAEKDLMKTLWKTLHIKDDLIHLLVDVLELRFESDRLLVSQSIATADVINLVVPTLLGVWKISQFTDSRWLSVGTSSRSMVSAQLTGLGSLLSFARQKPSVSGYYVNGFFRLTPCHWEFFVKAAIVAEVPEVAQRALLKDSRVALLAPSIRRDITSAMDDICGLHPFVWEKLAALADVHPGQLRADCCRSAHCAIGFMDFRFLAAAQFLWSLCRGGH